MPPRRKSTGKRSEPKLFRCTYNNTCNMVFTRSEHLARHERKHTGEKPFQCIVPGCERMFSRFDNMMQHTQTHNRNKRKPAMKTSRRRNSVPSMNNIKREPTIVLNEESKKMKSHNHHPSLPPNMTFITQSSLPPPPPPTSSSTKIHLKSSPPPPIITNNHMIESRTLPPPTRRASFSHFSPYYLPLNLSSSTPTNTAKSPTSTTHLLPDSFDDYKKISSNYFYSSSTFPNMNLSSPTDTFDYQKQSFLYRRGSLSTVSSSNSTISSSNDSQPSFDVPVPLSSSSTSSTSSSSSSFNYGRRRLSAADLQAPIQSLQERYADRHHPMYNGNSPTTTEFNISNPSLSSHPHDSIHPLQNNTSLANNKDTVDISTDEYEALQGFSKFSSQRLPEEKITNIQSPNMSAQVHAFRQKLLPIQESFQRPVRNT